MGIYIKIYIYTYIYSYIHIYIYIHLYMPHGDETVSDDQVLKYTKTWPCYDSGAERCHCNVASTPPRKLLDRRLELNC